jgi:hypothetical protein
MVEPMPNPRTSIPSEEWMRLESASSRERTTIPTIARAVPYSGKMR